MIDVTKNKSKKSKKTLFGLHSDYESSRFIIIPAPWDVSTSYYSGTSLGPESIKNASGQLDLSHPLFPSLSTQGIMMLDTPKKWSEENKRLRTMATPIISYFNENPDNTVDLPDDDITIQKQINIDSDCFINELSKEIATHLEKKKNVILVGGEHSVSLAYLKTLATHYPDFGVLQIDAHMDLREAYHGFIHSHASVMYNALAISELSQLTQVGVRDYCDEELDRSKNNPKIDTFFDFHLKRHTFKGVSWEKQCESIVKTLPEHVYISFDIDGLSPNHCPNTGTPVPGGLSFDEAIYLIECVTKSERKIIGADLVEVAPGKEREWDGNVGARVLYQLCGYMGLSQDNS